jgi:N-acetylglucosaminyl-diphospho-decaprenol L-rhamnosyltransferase
LPECVQALVDLEGTLLTAAPNSHDISCHDELDITIIIVSYNTREMTVECIRSVLEQTTAVRYELIVFDNASADGSVEAIRQNFPHVKVIASAQNVGFGMGNNLAAKDARGRRLLLLNPDTVVIDRAIERLHEFAVGFPKCGIWGGRTLSTDGSLDPTSCWRRQTLWSVFCYAFGLTTFQHNRLLNPEGYGGWKRDSIRAVDIVTGYFLLIDQKLWRQLKGFDPAFFMYGEEADLCLRARKLGARPMISPAPTIIHHAGGSESDKAERRIKILAGRVTLIRHHWPWFSYQLGRALYYIIPLPRWLAYGTAGIILGKNEYTQRARLWTDVWRARRRWINGWSDVAITKALTAPVSASDGSKRAD